MIDPPARSSAAPLVGHDVARQIWQAGLAAADSAHLVSQNVVCEDRHLCIAGRTFPWDELRQVLVVGGGKAGAGMVAGWERSLASAPIPWSGLVQVPDDCVGPTARIKLVGGRPAGHNYPTERGAVHAQRMLHMVQQADRRDLVVVLLSGGGSALLPAPTPPLTLSDKVKLTQSLAAAGADIRQLNLVRRAVSDIKGGKLAAACAADRMVTLIISDIIGDPLDLIASGPTWPPLHANGATDRAAALALVREYAQRGVDFPENLLRLLQSPFVEVQTDRRRPLELTHHVLGNNATAVQGAVRKAQALGFCTDVWEPETADTTALQAGQTWGARIYALQASLAQPTCVVWGGEPVVALPPPEERGTGGRNQHMALAALQWFHSRGLAGDGLVFLAGGTDGEDGPTDAAGAWWDRRLLQSLPPQSLEPDTALRRCDAYSFFRAHQGLLMTGPSHTNVCDLRVALIDPLAPRRI